METQTSYGMKIKSFTILLLLFALMPISKVFAEGSKDLYPKDAYGGRSTLRAHMQEQNFFPYPTMGTHYVFAKEGETIAIATSAQAFGTSNNTRNSNRNNITLFGLDGVAIPPSQFVSGSYGNNTDTWGRIDNRNAEIAGPRYSLESACY